MTKVGKRLCAAGIALVLAGSVSQVLGAEVRPDPLLAIDQNRSVVIERIVESFRPAFAPGQEATVRQALGSLRADHLLAASLAPSVDGLLAVLKSADSASAVVLAKPVGKALGDIAADVVYTPVTPCRIVDTRWEHVGTLAAGETRSLLASNPMGTFLEQGGSASNCGIPLKPAAVHVRMVAALMRSGPASLTAWPFAQERPLAWSLTWDAQNVREVANTFILPLCVGWGCTWDWTVYTSAATELIVDVTGYFSAPTGGHVVGGCPSGQAWRGVDAYGSPKCVSIGMSALHQPPLAPRVLDLASLPNGAAYYSGGFTDGVNGYVIGQVDAAGRFMGRVLRFDLDAFTPSGIATLDIAAVDPGAVGFQGGFTDGRYGYLVPGRNAAGRHGRVARVDLQDFSSSGVKILDLAAIDANLAGFHGGFTDGRYGYFVPFENDRGPFGKLVRVDLNDFSPSGVAALDLAAIDPQLVYLTRGVTNGRHAVLATRSGAHGKVVRIDLANFSAPGVRVIDLASIDPGLRGFYCGFSDASHAYFVAFDTGSGHTGKVARIDLANFSASGVTVLDVARADPDLRGFRGCFTDGRYAWLAPYAGRKAARIDLATFDVSGVVAVDYEHVDPAATRFLSGFTNGRFGVFVPYSTPSRAGSSLVRLQLFHGPGSP